MPDRYGSDDFFGAAFCLSLELGFAGDDAHAAAALSVLWSCPRVEGPWAEPGDIGQTAPRGDIAAARFGLLTSDLVGRFLAFGVSLVREKRAPGMEPPSDWLTLDIPVRVLAAVWPVDNTWSVERQPWLLPLSRALATIADRVHARAPVLGGVVGEEVSGCWRVPTATRAENAEQGYPPLAVLTAAAIEERGGFVVTPSLWRHLAPRTDATALPSGLLYAAPRPAARLTGA